MNENNARQGDKKEQTLQAAIELFATLGYENTSIAAICTHANVSKGLVFHHFKNKEDLLRAVFLRMAQLINEVSVDANAKASAAVVTPKERFIHLVEQIFTSMANAEQKRYYQLDYQIKCQPAMREILKDLLDARYQLMMASFEPILAMVPAADVLVDSHSLIAEIDGIALNYLFADDTYPLAAIKARFIKKQLLLLGLA
uniref:TetR/AcrR family transcriptional regulator n=1 Tax=Thaumasiovibrio occultus TaxID=1891184 RepID=UPI000B3645EE|nr:TetR/AcrR family transcriptional regulator [Thaumasiovibrio occultus]